MRLKFDRLPLRRSFRRQPVNRRQRANPPARLLRFEPLEDRRLLTITVNTLIDENNGIFIGGISLREAIAAAAAAETINFSVTGTIDLTSPGQLTINKNLTISGPGADRLTINAFDPTPASKNGDGNRVFNVDDGGAGARTVSISGLTLTGGDVTGNGGAIRSLENLTLTSSTVSGNTVTSQGGGIYSRDGALSIVASTLSGNRGAYGGGLLGRYGSVTVTRSTISANQSPNSNGGGIEAVFTTLTVSDSTISGNSSGAGGGILSYFSTASVARSTITNNLGNFAGGGINVTGAGSMSLDHTIVAGNTRGGSTRDDIAGAVTARFTLIGDNTGATITDNGGNLIGTSLLPKDPLLSPLADNGGPTKTHALLVGSPAIDMGDASFVPPPTTDQRGAPFVRVFDGDGAGGARIDIGAYERQTVAGLSLVVDTVVDESDGNYAAGDFSLREAIGLANGSMGANTITFAASLTSGGAVGIFLTKGELAISDAVMINGPAPNLLVINALAQSRVINITANTGDFTISGLTLTGGKTTGNKLNSSDTTYEGAGLRSITTGSLTLNRVTVTGNHTYGYGARGGGISAFGYLQLIESTVMSNSTSGTDADGGGVFVGFPVTITRSTISGNSTAGDRSTGGGISIYSGFLHLNQSTISGNSTAGNRSYGGGIYGGNMSLVESTISGNSTIGSQSDGGGIFSYGQTLEIIRSTVTLNSTTAAFNNGGGIMQDSFAFDVPMTITGSIIAGNTAAGTGPDFVADFPSALTVHYSLIGNTSGSGITGTSGFGNILNQNAQLGPLANNVGPTQTHSLLPTSPAINTGDPSAVAGVGEVPLYDQRGVGFPRIDGGWIDMGSYESNAFTKFTVNTLADENNGIGVGGVSLREAIGAANVAANPSIIDFSPALNSGSINLSSLGEINIAKSMTIIGPGADLLTVRAYDLVPATKTGNGSRIFNIDNVNGILDITAVISGLTLTGGDVTGAGGAILSTENLNLFDVQITDSYATTNGGGIRHAFGTVHVNDSTIANNRAEQNGGGLQIDTANAFAEFTRTTVRDNRATLDGAGINNVGATLLVVHSAVLGNIASDDGGGIKSDTNLLGTQTTTIINTTLSGNSATTRGGGIYNVDGLTVLRHSTVAFNSAGAGGGFASFGDNNTLSRVYLSILTSNTNGDAQFVTGVVNNSFESQGYNRVTTGNAFGDFNQTGDLTGFAVALSPLADNGGPTLTHALPAGSIAINAGPNLAPGFNGVPQYDQRGNPFERVRNGNTPGGKPIDIGAFEVQTIPPAFYGDYNQNGVVDTADFVVWRKGLGTFIDTPYGGADGDGNGKIDSNDYVVWRAHFGQTVPPPPADPGAASLAAADAVLVIREPIATAAGESISPQFDAKSQAMQEMSFTSAPPSLMQRDLGSRSAARINAVQSSGFDDGQLLLALAIDRVGHLPQSGLSSVNGGPNDFDADHELDQTSLANKTLAEVLALWRWACVI